MQIEGFKVKNSDAFVRSGMKIAGRLSEARIRRPGLSTTALKDKLKHLEDQLVDRDIRLNEVEHRAKNSLQLAVALLVMEQKRTMDKAAASVLGDSARRLTALAEIHRLMYSGTGNDRVAMRPWLHSVTRGFVDAGMALRIDCPQVSWPFATASVVGLFAGEAVANCVKHAATPEGGDVVVSLEPKAPSTWCLTVLDDGPGLGGESSAGLGLRVLGAFARQLKGEVAFSKGLDGRGCGVSLLFAGPEA